MQQLSIFDSPPEKKQTGFKYRRRLYDSKKNYLYTAIPTEKGYRLIPISIWIKDNEIIELTHSEYVQYLKTNDLTEVLPKDVEERMR